MFIFIAMLCAGCSMKTSAPHTPTPAKTSQNPCPTFGWSEGLGVYMKAETPMPTAFSANADDCEFNQWSWEAFIWATAKIEGRPRFMSFATPASLGPKARPHSNASLLRLSSRATTGHGGSEPTEGAGAIVEADGSVLVGLNGYPVYASVHMNPSYYKTAKNNMIWDDGYKNNANKDYFEVGAGIIKATWYRLGEGEQAPAGSYTTQAEVPVLSRKVLGGFGSPELVVTTGQFETVTVALVGVHVVGYVEHHPEFLWATFEHNKNAPMLADNSFTPSSDKSDPNNYTFYTAGTPFSEVLQPTQPATPQSPALVAFNDAKGTFTPVTQVVQMNRTGGDNQPNGPQNIDAINTQAQGFVASNIKGEPDHFSQFAHYNLIGTVWMKPDTYVRSTPNWQDLNQANAVGAVDLANSTAETFVQNADNSVPPKQWGNCFACHNPTSYTFQHKGDQPKRLIGISHVLSEGTPFAVPNHIPVKRASLPPAAQ